MLPPSGGEGFMFPLFYSILCAFAGYFFIPPSREILSLTTPSKIRLIHARSRKNHPFPPPKISRFSHFLNKITQKLIKISKNQHVLNALLPTKRVCESNFPQKSAANTKASTPAARPAETTFDTSFLHPLLHCLHKLSHLGKPFRVD